MTAEGFHESSSMHLGPGAYLLVIRLPSAQTITVGRLGEVRFKRGHYVYCGSAKNGISGRVARHLRTKGKRLHWHIDYLLAQKGVRLVEAWAFPGRRPTECDLVSACAGSLHGQVHPKGFGASDCRAKCGGHLVRFERKPLISELPFDKKVRIRIIENSL